MNNILHDIQLSLTKKEVELVFVDSKDMQEINLEQRGFDKTTDVLSFPLMEVEGMPLGSIVINSELAQEKADELGHTKEEEESLLFIHGILHLLGYDHEVDSGEMRKMEEKIIKKFSLPESLILRNE